MTGISLLAGPDPLGGMEAATSQPAPVVLESVEGGYIMHHQAPTLAPPAQQQSVGYAAQSVGNQPVTA